MAPAMLASHVQAVRQTVVSALIVVAITSVLVLKTVARARETAVAVSQQVTKPGGKPPTVTFLQVAPLAPQSNHSFSQPTVLPQTV